MDYAGITTAFTLIVLLFSLGAILMFLYQVKLGFRKSKFSCSMCGNCCRLRIIQIQKEDIARLKKAGYKNFYDKAGSEYWMKRKKGRCVFLKNDLCSVHKVRPQICRDFPFFKRFGLTYCRVVSFCPSVEALRKNA